MRGPVFVIGAGVVCAIGRNQAECHERLRAGEDGIGPMRYLRSVHAGALPVAEVPYSNQELAAYAGMPDVLPRTALLSALAAREALATAGLEGESQRWRKGFVSANTVGGMDLTESFFGAYMQDPAGGRLRDVVHHECGSVSELVADRLGIRDYRSTISTACSSSANSIAHAARMIQAGRLDAAVAGGADALTRFTLNGFNTLMILDGSPCRPFDDTRQGLNLGEGAGYLVLASATYVERTGAQPIAQLTGYCNANDAFHQTASSPEGQGSYLAMTGAMAMGRLAPDEIGYINLHGTGTHNNDLSEGTAIRRIFGGSPPPMSSTKSYTGHTLGASGGVEAVFSIMAIRNRCIYPNLRFAHRMQELPFAPETTFREDADIEHVLSNSFGFGGNCSSLILSRA